MLDTFINASIDFVVVLPVDEDICEIYFFEQTLGDVLTLVFHPSTNENGAMRVSTPQANNGIRILLQQGWNGLYTQNAKFRISVLSRYSAIPEQVDILVVTLQQKLGRDLIPVIPDNHG